MLEVEAPWCETKQPLPKKQNWTCQLHTKSKDTPALIEKEPKTSVQPDPVLTPAERARALVYEDCVQRLERLATVKLESVQQPDFVATRFADELRFLALLSDEERDKFRRPLCVRDRPKDWLQVRLGWQLLLGAYPQLELLRLVKRHVWPRGVEVNQEALALKMYTMTHEEMRLFQRCEKSFCVVQLVDAEGQRAELDIELELLWACAPYAERCHRLYLDRLLECDADTQLALAEADLTRL